MGNWCRCRKCRGETAQQVRSSLITSLMSRSSRSTGHSENGEQTPKGNWSTKGMPKFPTTIRTSQSTMLEEELNASPAYGTQVPLLVSFILPKHCNVGYSELNQQPHSPHPVDSLCDKGTLLTRHYPRTLFGVDEQCFCCCAVQKRCSSNPSRRVAAGQAH